MAKRSTSYKCPNCDAPLEYKPGSSDNIKCEYCETEFTAKALQEFFAASDAAAAEAQEAAESKWKTEDAGGEWDPEEAAIMRAMTCSSCGAEVTCDENTMATECVYCGNPTMIAGRFSKQLKPDFIIPFQMSKEYAMQAFKEFHSGKWLLPGNFATKNRMESIQGMYVPYWLFDSSVEGSATFDATNSRSYTDGDYKVTETDHYKCYRRGSMQFNRVPADGSEKMDDTWMESVEPFEYDQLEKFNTTYMAGYLADKYDVESDKLVTRVDSRMKETVADVLEDTVTGFDTVSLDTCNMKKNEGSVSYCMAPVWILTNKYEGENYTFLVNGQTGKMVGSLPIDTMKEKMYGLAAFLISLPITYLTCKFIINALLSD